MPPFLRNSGKGWVTARIRHAAARHLDAHASARPARARSAAHAGDPAADRPLAAIRRCASPELGERTIWLDCDVIQADGGTRTASITGGFVALALALRKLRDSGVLAAIPVTDYVAATSVGVVDGEPMLDLAYDEDSRADVDMNVVKTGDGRFVEVQGTAEGRPFERQALDSLMELADRGSAASWTSSAASPAP